MEYCAYYQAHVRKEEAGFLVAVLRSFEHLAFDRTIDKASSLFEFFVPVGSEAIFVELMEDFLKEGVILDLVKQENRLRNPESIL